MEAHHYCKVVNDDLLQCVLFDGNTSDANLIGIEYIVSGELFDTLLEEERSYWHTWHTDSHGSRPGMDPPLGDPRLMWSFNRDGECAEDLRLERNQGIFSGTTPVPGVVDVPATD